MNYLWLLGLMGLLFGLSSGARGHAVDQGYIYLSILDTQIDVRLELNVKDVNRALTLSLPTDGTLSQEQLLKHVDSLKAYVEKHVSMAPDSQPHPLVFVKPSIRDTEFGQFVMLDYRLEDLAEPPSTIDIKYALVFEQYPDHRGFVLIENDWRTQVYENEARYSLVFDPDDQQRELRLDEASVLSGVLGMIENGMHHIWIGIDHLLFLFALLLPAVLLRESGQWQASPSLREAMWQVFKVVTMFTLGHTITLCLAALGIVSLPSRLVESVIAASIAVAAVDIIYPWLGRRIMAVIFGFGLVHGFGFANVLAEMPIPEPYVVPSLFGFNVGVEIGQLVVVVAIFPILFLLRNFTFYRRWILPAAALGLIVVSMYWFIERAFEVDLPAGAIIKPLLGIPLNE